MEDPETHRMLEQLLGDRLRDTIEILMRLATSSAGSPPAAPPTPPPPPPPRSQAQEFVDALLAWIVDTGRGSEKGARYLLMWQAKKLAQEPPIQLPDAAEIVALIRAQLSPAELDDVDRMIENGFKSVDYGHRLQVLGCRLRKQFIASLTPEQHKRFGRYLPAFVPAFTGFEALDSGAAAPPAGSAGVQEPAASWLASHAASVVIALGLPALAAVGWLVVRGSDAGTRNAPPIEQRDAAAGEVRAHVGSSGDRSPELVPTDDATAAGGSALAAGPAAFTWTRRSAGVTGQLQGIAWSGARAVVAGLEGSIAWSDDLETWTPAPQLSSYGYGSAAWGKGVFVVVGGYRIGATGRIISTSADGASWVTQAWEERTVLTSVSYGDGAFVAVGLRGAIVRSADGTSWQAATSGTSEHLSGVSYANGRFVANGNLGIVLVSDDGVTWTSRRHASGYQFFRVAHDGTRWLMLGGGDGPVAAAAISTDLERWVEHALPGLTYFRNVAFAGDRFVAASADGVLSSTDGLVWTLEVPPADLVGAGDVLWTGAVVIAVGARGTIYIATARP